MLIRIQPLNKAGFTLSVEDNETVLELKEKIKEITGVPVCEMRLLYPHRHFALSDDEAELGTCDLEEMDLVYMVKRQFLCRKCLGY